MYTKFATLGFIAAAVMSAVSATAEVQGTASVAQVAGGIDQARAGLLTAAKRSYLSRRKVAAVLQRRNDNCDHKKHKTFKRGDEHKRPRHHRIENHHCGGNLAHCDSDSDAFEHRFGLDSDEFEHRGGRDSDEFEHRGGRDSDEYEHRDFEDDEDDLDFDDDDFFDCDECEACDDDEFNYMNWRDIQDEFTK